MTQNFAKLKTDLMTKGIRIEGGVNKGRKSGAGPAGGRFFRFKDGSCVNVPIWPQFTTQSPYSLKNDQVFFNGSRLYDIELIPVPKFYSKLTSDNIPMKKIALVHGIDSLASTVIQTCEYWRKNLQCKFCGIELSLQSGSTIRVKTPKQLREVVGAAIEENLCRHLTLTMGSVDRPDKGAAIYGAIVKEIKEFYDIPIHVQLEPPEKPEYLEDLYNYGVDTIGIHIESFDKKVLQEICPGKISISLEKYKEAWKYGVKIFGENQVESYILLGLGETDSSIIEGSKLLMGIGVLPHVVPFRPIAGTPMETHPSPTSSRILKIFTQLAKILRDYGLDPTKNKAGCVRCGACSLLTEGFKYF